MPIGEPAQPETPATDTHLGRRDLLFGATAAALLAATHGPWLWGLSKEQGASGPENGAHRIRSLRLATTASLEEMREFYCGLLGLKALEATATRLTLAAGATALTFEPGAKDSGPDSANENGGPRYHFAFNIPENKILAAREWQLQRSVLMPTPDHLRDPRFPDDVVHFSHWDAHSIFFWDPAGNWVEYIARHTLENSAPGPFTTQDILYASEIAFAVADVPQEAKRMGGGLELPTYGRGSEAFHALGDEHGLLLVMKQGRKMAFGAGPGIATWPVDAQIRGGETQSLALAGYPFEIRVQDAG